MVSKQSPEDLSRQSRNLLDDLGDSLRQLFDPAKMPDDQSFDDLLKKLDDLGHRDGRLKAANSSLSTILSKYS
jgi:hypothetical protein